MDKHINLNVYVYIYIYIYIRAYCVCVCLSTAIELDEAEKIFKTFFHLKYALFSTCESHLESLPTPQRHRI